MFFWSNNNSGFFKKILGMFFSMSFCMTIIMEIMDKAWSKLLSRLSLKRKKIFYKISICFLCVCVCVCWFVDQRIKDHLNALLDYLINQKSRLINRTIESPPKDWWFCNWSWTKHNMAILDSSKCLYTQNMYYTVLEMVCYLCIELIIYMWPLLH